MADRPAASVSPTSTRRFQFMSAIPRRRAAGPRGHRQPRLGQRRSHELPASARHAGRDLRSISTKSRPRSRRGDMTSTTSRSRKGSIERFRTPSGSRWTSCAGADNDVVKVYVDGAAPGHRQVVGELLPQRFREGPVRQPGSGRRSAAAARQLDRAAGDPGQGIPDRRREPAQLWRPGRRRRSRRSRGSRRTRRYSPVSTAAVAPDRPGPALGARPASPAPRHTSAKRGSREHPGGAAEPAHRRRLAAPALPGQAPASAAATSR